MKNKTEESEFIQLLRLNDKDKLKKYIFENGKEGKPFCPISFGVGEKDYDKNKEITKE